MVKELTYSVLGRRETGRVPPPKSVGVDGHLGGLHNTPEEIKRILKERSLWTERGLVLECPAIHNRPGCAPEGGCYSRRVLEAERGFQKGRLQEEAEALGHRVLFYPTFHCELNLSSSNGAEQNGSQEKIGVLL